MGSSYKKEVNKYKEKKNSPVDDAPMPHRKKKKKKHKKSDHKHIYVPGVYHFIYKRWTGDKINATCYGHHCSICGRIQDFWFLFLSEYNNNQQLDDFKKEHPNYVEIFIPYEWDYTKQCVPKEFL